MDDLTPLSLDEWERIAMEEYRHMTTGGIVLLSGQCRAFCPHMAVSVCIRKKNHTGLHVVTNPIVTWSRSVNDRYAGRGGARKGQYGY
jgi:hypothetical protein